MTSSGNGAVREFDDVDIKIIQLLQQINQWGTTVIMATHDRDIVNSLRNRVIRIEEGAVVEDNKVGSYN